jgi:mRNA-degrading endonuclease toxin of MazEF toxin-antitoxin module
MVTISRGDVVLCDLNPVMGSEQAGIRPVVVLQSLVYRKYKCLNITSYNIN